VKLLPEIVCGKDILESGQGVIQTGDITSEIISEEKSHATHQNVTKSEEEVIGLEDTTEIISQEKSHAAHQKDIIKSEQEVIQVLNITTEIISQEKSHVTDKNVTKSEEVIGLGDTTEIISQEKSHATHQDIIKSEQEVIQVGGITTEIILQEKPPRVTDKVTTLN
jgi:hypothetical protein